MALVLDIVYTYQCHQPFGSEEQKVNYHIKTWQPNRQLGHVTGTIYIDFPSQTGKTVIMVDHGHHGCWRSTMFFHVQPSNTMEKNKTMSILWWPWESTADKRSKFTTWWLSMVDHGQFFPLYSINSFFSVCLFAEYKSNRSIENTHYWCYRPWEWRVFNTRRLQPISSWPKSDH